eukprot:SAG31_NODE_1573_length_7850_cov_1.757193_10_plen_194_part_00
MPVPTACSQARYGAGVVQFTVPSVGSNVQDQSVMVALGGEDPAHRMLQTAELYMDGPDTWRPLPEAKLPSARVDFAAGVLAPGSFWGGKAIGQMDDSRPRTAMTPLEEQRRRQGKVSKLMDHYSTGDKSEAPWTEEEEEALIHMVKRDGIDPRHWKKKAKDLGTGRSADSVAEHYKILEERKSVNSLLGALHC